MMSFKAHCDPIVGSGSSSVVVVLAINLHSRAPSAGNVAVLRKMCHGGLFCCNFDLF